VSDITILQQEKGLKLIKRQYICNYRRYIVTINIFDIIYRYNNQIINRLVKNNDLVLMAYTRDIIMLHDGSKFLRTLLCGLILYYTSQSRRE